MFETWRGRMSDGKIEHFFNVGKKFVLDRNYRNIILAEHGFYRLMSDELYLKLIFQAKMGQPLCLEKPKTFNEKLQWLKLYDRQSEYTIMVDKYEVRKYIAKKIGEEYLIPLLGTWDIPDEIDFARLPNQFVLKCNHNSGLGMCICKEKDKIDFSKVKKQLRAGLKEDYYQKYREWPYKDVPRKIIAEKYLEDKDQTAGIIDYKIHNFNGKPQIILVCQNRFQKTGMTEDFFDTHWNHLDISREKHRIAEACPMRPENLEKMLELAGILSENIPFLRTDFYEVEGKLYFGELTFFPATGMEKFIPEKWDTILGDWLILPEKYI